jgi:hypothetical protein
MIGHSSWRRRLAAASLAAALWGAAASVALAQVNGSIAGRVQEEGGPAVAGATVTARNLATGFRQSAISEASGAYRIEALPAGSYDVAAEASGFGTGLSTGVVVHASEFTNVAFALKRAAAPIAVAVQEPQGQAGAPPPDPMKKGPRMQIYGFAMVDLINDFDQVNPDWFDVERPTKLPSFPNEFGDNGNFWASVRQTRFGVRGWLPTGLGEVKTEFEFDLFGVGVDAGQTTIRLRQAWGSLGQFLAGQTNSVFMDGDVFPNVVEYWGPNGMVFFRNVQVRWTPIQGDSELAFAIERPGASADSGSYADRIQLENVKGHFPYPDVTAHYRFGDKWGHVQLAGIFRYMGWTDTNPDPPDISGHAIGWGANLSSVIKVGKTGNIRLEATYGHGIENYMNDAPVDVGVQSNPGQLATGKALPIFGMVAYYDFNWSDTFSTAIGYSRLDIDNSDGQLPNAFKSGQYASTNVLWYPVKNVMTGMEFQWGRRQNFTDGFAVNDFRIQFSAQYKFSFDLGGK